MAKIVETYDRIGRRPAAGTFLKADLCCGATARAIDKGWTYQGGRLLLSIADALGWSMPYLNGYIDAFDKRGAGDWEDYDDNHNWLDEYRRGYNLGQRDRRALVAAGIGIVDV